MVGKIRQCTHFDDCYIQICCYNEVCYKMTALYKHLAVPEEFCVVFVVCFLDLFSNLLRNASFVLEI